MGSPSVGPNNSDTGKTSGRKNAIAVTGGISGGGIVVVVKSDIRNEGAGELKRDAKVGSEVQPKGDVKVGSKV